MEKIYNIQTGLPEDLSPDVAATSIASGTHAYKKGARVDLVDPEGQSYNLDASEVHDAIKAGWKPESSDQIEIRKSVKANEGLIGGLKVGVGQLVDEALLGIPEKIYDETANPLDVAKKNAIKESHEGWNAVGGTAGFATGLLNPAGVAGKLALPASQLFKGAAKLGSLTERGLVGAGSKSALANTGAKIASGVVEGATVSAPMAVTEAMLGDPNQAAETLLAGGMFGGVLNGVSSGAKGLLKLGKDKVENFTKLKSFDEDSALNAINATPAQRMKLQETAPDVVEKLPEVLRGMVKDDASILFDAKKMQARVKEIKATSGKGIGDIIKEADILVKDKMKFGDDIAKAELESLGFNAPELAQKLDDKLAPYRNDERYASYVKEVENEIEFLNKFTKPDGTNTMSTDIKAWRDYQNRTSDLVNYDRVANRVDLAADARKLIVKEVQNYFKDGLPKLMEKVSPGMKAKIEQFKQFNDLYRVAATIEKVTKKSAGKAAVAPFLSMKDIIAGGLGSSIGGLPGVIASIGVKKIADYGKRALDVGGILKANESIQAVAKKMQSIGKTLKNYDQPVRSAAAVKLSSITGNSEDDNFDKLSEKLVTFNQNPQNSEIVRAFGAMAETGAPKVAEAATLQTIEAAKYLLSVMPKALTPDNPLVKGKKFKPSDMELNKFKRQVRTALDPMSAIDDLNENTLTVEQVEVLSALYPSILEEIRFNVTTAVAENPTAIPYNKRIKLSLLLGADLDPSLEQSTLQIIIGAPPEQQPQQVEGGNPNAKFATNFSENQRIQNDLKA